MQIKRKITFGTKRPEFPKGLDIKIRLATLFDINDIMELSILLRQKAPLYYIAPKTISSGNLQNFRSECLKAIKSECLVLVAENCNGIQGFIFGGLLPNIWSDSSVGLEEFALYAYSKRVLFLLVKEYIARAKVLKAQKKIHFFTLAQLPESTTDYNKLGLTLVEKSWAG